MSKSNTLIRPALNLLGPPVNAAEFASLLSAARLRDPGAWEAIAARFRGELIELARPAVSWRLRPKADAEDLVQEALLMAFRHLDGFRGRTMAEFSAWLRRLLGSRISHFVRRYAGTQGRNAGREVSLHPPNTGGAADPATSATSPSGAAIRAEQRGRVGRALLALPADYRLVLEGRERQGLSFAQIAELMGRSENAVRKLWPRALLALKAELEKEP